MKLIINSRVNRLPFYRKSALFNYGQYERAVSTFYNNNLSPGLAYVQRTSFSVQV